MFLLVCFTLVDRVEGQSVEGFGAASGFVASAFVLVGNSAFSSQAVHGCAVTRIAESFFASPCMPPLSDLCAKSPALDLLYGPGMTRKAVP